MVFYRKYRPQTIAELDSPKLRETLTKVLSQKEIPHAFLFTGPKGLGKTSTARIIAKVLNCTHNAESSVSGHKSLAKDQGPRTKDQIEPCNACSQCISITNGTNIDVLEIDGASNRGIDEIRDLREKVHLAPSSAKKKVYIIDEVHMLTTEAFNALLKTIEEPPSHVVFIFATTEPQKVPATIISRCFHVSLSKATPEELIHALKRITKEEKIDIDDEALALIAEMGDGGYRDATKILEELVALSDGQKITKKMVEEMLNIAMVSQFDSGILESLERKDSKKGLLVVRKIAESGVDFKFFLSQLLSAFHELLLQKIGIEQAVNNQQRTTSFSIQELQELITLFSKAYQDMKYSPLPSLPLELAIVMWCQSENQPVIARSETTKQTYIGNDSSKPSIKDTRTKEQNLKVQQVLSGEKPLEKKPVASNATQTDLPKDIKDSNLLLENLIYKVKPYNHSVAGVLRGCKIASMTDDAITFETPYKFHKEKLEEQKIRDILEQVVREVTGKKLQVMIELKK